MVPGTAYYFDEQYVDADSTFEKMMDIQAIDKLPFQVLLFSARSKANIDSTMTTGLAKPMYEAFLDRISTNLSKYDDEAIEGYSYLGAYYVHREENIVKAKVVIKNTGARRIQSHSQRIYENHKRTRAEKGRIVLKNWQIVQDLLDPY